MADWKLPADIQAELSQTYRRCARCKFHVKDWGTTSSYCPLCNAAYKRERRAARKAEGKMQWTVKKCSKCGAEDVCPPDSSQCRACRNAYQRAYKQAHPPKTPPPTVPGKWETRKCSHCGKRRPYTVKEGWRGGVCGKCQQGYRKKADAAQKEKRRQWRETAAPVNCRQCHQVKPYGRGWNGRLCPQCQSVQAAERYARTKANPEKWAKWQATQAAGYQRRQRWQRRQDVSSPSASVSVGLVEQKSEKTEYAPQG